MKKSMKKLDTYLANLYVANVYLHYLHWNVVGPAFKTVHEYLEALYDETFENLDEVAELQKMNGVYPKASMKSYLELTTLKEFESDKDIEQKKAVELAVALLKELRKTALDTRETADEEEFFQVANMMEDQVTNYDKHIWFLESMLK